LFVIVAQSEGVEEAFSNHKQRSRRMVQGSGNSLENSYQTSARG
jgi:hypothetical protein